MIKRQDLTAKIGVPAGSPFGDDEKIRIINVTEHGIAFEHPEKGHCGMRFDSMTDKNISLINGFNGLEAHITSKDNE